MRCCASINHNEEYRKDCYGTQVSEEVREFAMMKRTSLSFWLHHLRPHLFAAILFLISLLIALLSGLLFFNASLIGNLITTLSAFGLDPLRARFIASLIMTAGAAFIGAIWVRRKVGALVGASIVFNFAYLLDFIRLEQQPVRDPGGLLEPLDTGALAHTTVIMIAIALLCAFVGAVLGVAFGDVLLSPFYRLAQVIWQRQASRNSISIAKKVNEQRPSTKITIAGSWLGVAAMVLLLFLASNSTNLFLYSPDLGLHIQPSLHNADGLPAHGTIVQENLVSPALGGQKKPFLVYLPPSYNTPQGRTKHYPTLYLLHGSPGQDIDWFAAGKANQSADTLIDSNKIPELILVLPDGNGRPGETSEWGNSSDGHQNIETYVAVDLVKYVDSKYRTLTGPAYRGIGGLSMGGFGAMNIAVHHPNVFGFVIALGGYYRAEGSVWGNNATYIRANSSIDVLPEMPQAWKLHIFLGAATKDQPYYNDTIQFKQVLQRLHIPYHLDIEDGYHAWTVWQIQLYKALLWLHWG